MRILMVTERYLPIWGGAENQLKILSEELSELGYEIDIVTRHWKPELLKKEQHGQSTIYRIGLPVDNFLGTLSFIISLIYFTLKNRKNYSIIHSHGAVNLGALIAFIALFTRIPTVGKIATAGKIIPLTSNITGKAILFWFKKLNRVIAMSKEIQHELRVAGLLEQQLTRIENGVDCQVFHPASDSKRKKWRVNHKLSESAVIAIFSGRLVKRKGVDILLESWKSISNDHPGAYLFILGDGANQGDSVETELHNQVQQKKIQNIFFEGNVASPQEYLNIADIFIFPSRLEGFPNALLEAMAAGNTVIASKIGGNEDLVRDGETGYLFETNNSPQLADLISLTINDKELRNELSIASRSYILKNNAIHEIALQYKKLYKLMNNEPANVQSNKNY